MTTRLKFLSLNRTELHKLIEERTNYLADLQGIDIYRLTYKKPRSKVGCIEHLNFIERSISEAWDAIEANAEAGSLENYRKLQQELTAWKNSGTLLQCKLNAKKEVLEAELDRIEREAIGADVEEDEDESGETNDVLLATTPIELKEYRCTRNVLHQNPRRHSCHDLKLRQGYYIQAKSSEEALQIMAQKFPQDIRSGIHPVDAFTVDLGEGDNR